jgi:hypothetical protein
MIARIGSGWQTVLADLSMILFMITASALSNAPATPAKGAAHPRAPVIASPRAEPVGVWRDGADAPPLATWLAQQPADPWVRLTILVRYTGGARDDAMKQAGRLLLAAGPRGLDARVLIEPGTQAGASVTLAYDTENASPAPALNPAPNLAH